MSTVRIQVRRGTAAQWTSANPVLEAGEMGLETDTKYIKFGDGTAAWSALGYANDPGFLDLSNQLVNYVELTDIGAVSGVAGLDSSKNLLVPGASIIVEGSTNNEFETTLTVTNPTADRTITFPDATGTVALAENVAALSGATFTGNINIPTAITFEGATADSYETTIQVTDPTADRTIIVPDAAGTIALTSNIPSTTDGLSEGSTNKYFTSTKTNTYPKSNTNNNKNSNTNRNTYNDTNSKFRSL